MTVLQIVANRPGAGKTCLAGALLSRLAAAGQAAAWYKPLSPTPENDPDVAFMSELLAPAAVPPPLAQPFDPAADADAAALAPERRAEIAAVVAGLAAAFDPVLVEWAAPVAADAAAAPVLPGYPVLLLHGYVAGQAAAIQAATIAAAAETLGADLGGILINGVLRYRWQETEREIIAPRREQGLPVLGAIPESRLMLALTLQQVAEALDGRWIQEPADFAEGIDRFLIGGNIMDSGPNYFGRYARQGVITRGGRPDIQLACLAAGNTRLLTLTGGVEPTEYIRVTARQRGTPLLLTDGDTLDVAATLAGRLEQAHPYSPEKLSHFAALMEEHLDGWPDALLG